MQKNSGYTIIEVMIFLAVSGALMVSVMATVSGQQQKTQFITGVRDFETKLQDVVNDVETGYYPNNGSTRCVANATGIETEPVTDPDVQPQGTNTACTFLGKSIEFYPGTSGAGNTAFRSTTIAGARLKADGTEVIDIDDAKPIAFNLNGNGVETGQLQNGLELSDIKYWASDLSQPVAPADPVRFVGVLANIGTTSRASGTVASLTGRPKLVYMTGGTIDSTTINGAAIDNASGGAAFCLRDGSNGRVAAVTLGIRLSGQAPPAPQFQVTGQNFSTEVYFDNDAARFGCS